MRVCLLLVGKITVPYRFHFMDINSAITRYEDWQRPWEFENKVNELLSEEDAVKFGMIMAFAHKSEKWLIVDLSECSESVRRELLENFTYLTEGSARAISNAASYQWR